MFTQFRNTSLVVETNCRTIPATESGSSGSTFPPMTLVAQSSKSQSKSRQHSSSSSSSSGDCLCEFDYEFVSLNRSSAGFSESSSSSPQSLSSSSSSSWPELSPSPDSKLLRRISTSADGGTQNPFDAIAHHCVDPSDHTNRGYSQECGRDLARSGVVAVETFIPQEIMLMDDKGAEGYATEPTPKVCSTEGALSQAERDTQQKKSVDHVNHRGDRVDDDEDQHEGEEDKEEEHVEKKAHDEDECEEDEEFSTDMSTMLKRQAARKRQLMQLRCEMARADALRALRQALHLGLDGFKDDHNGCGAQHAARRAVGNTNTPCEEKEFVSPIALPGPKCNAGLDSSSSVAFPSTARTSDISASSGSGSGTNCGRTSGHRSDPKDKDTSSSGSFSRPSCPSDAADHNKKYSTHKTPSADAMATIDLQSLATCDSRDASDVDCSCDGFRLVRRPMRATRQDGGADITSPDLILWEEGQPKVSPPVRSHAMPERESQSQSQSQLQPQAQHKEVQRQVNAVGLMAAHQLSIDTTTTKRSALVGPAFIESPLQLCGRQIGSPIGASRGVPVSIPVCRLYPPRGRHSLTSPLLPKRSQGYEDEEGDKESNEEEEDEAEARSLKDITASYHKLPSDSWEQSKSSPKSSSSSRPSDRRGSGSDEAMKISSNTSRSECSEDAINLGIDANPDSSSSSIISLVFFDGKYRGRSSGLRISRADAERLARASPFFQRLVDGAKGREIIIVDDNPFEAGKFLMTVVDTLREAQHCISADRVQQASADGITSSTSSTSSDGSSENAGTTKTGANAAAAAHASAGGDRGAHTVTRVALEVPWNQAWAEMSLRWALPQLAEHFAKVADRHIQNALDKNLLTSFQVSGASCSAREINGYYDLTLENSFGQPAYRRRGDTDTWLICFRSGSANIWNITEERARGNMYTGFAYITCSEDMTPDHSPSSWRVYNEGIWRGQPDMRIHKAVAMGDIQTLWEAAELIFKYPQMRQLYEKILSLRAAPLGENSLRSAMGSRSSPTIRDKKELLRVLADRHDLLAPEWMKKVLSCNDLCDLVIMLKLT